MLAWPCIVRLLFGRIARLELAELRPEWLHDPVGRLCSVSWAFVAIPAELRPPKDTWSAPVDLSADACSRFRLVMGGRARHLLPSHLADDEFVVCSQGHTRAERAPMLQLPPSTRDSPSLAYSISSGSILKGSVSYSGMYSVNGPARAVPLLTRLAINTVQSCSCLYVTPSGLTAQMPKWQPRMMATGYRQEL